MTGQAALSFGGMLRQLRTEARLTQEELAEAAKVSPRSVSDLERGINRTARKDTAELLANALGLAGAVRELFVAAARGRASAAEVLAAMRGEASAAASAGPAPGRGTVWAGCPYLGLVPFQERDKRVFYGRGEYQLVRQYNPPRRLWPLQFSDGYLRGQNDLGAVPVGGGPGTEPAPGRERVDTADGGGDPG